MEFNIETGKYADHLVNNDQELKDAENFEFYPVPPVKIRSCEIDMRDDFNGNVVITFSDAGRIEYNCKETYKRGEGPSYEVTLRYNDKVVDFDGDFLDQYVGGYGGWVLGLTQFYVDIKLRKITF